MYKYFGLTLVSVCLSSPLMAQDDPSNEPERESIEYECRMKVAKQRPPELKIESLVARCIENTRRKDPTREPEPENSGEGPRIDHNTRKPLPPSAEE